MMSANLTPCTNICISVCIGQSVVPILSVYDLAQYFSLWCIYKKCKCGWIPLILLFKLRSRRSTSAYRTKLSNPGTLSPSCTLAPRWNNSLINCRVNCITNSKDDAPNCDARIWLDTAQCLSGLQLRIVRLGFNNQPELDQSKRTNDILQLVYPQFACLPAETMTEVKRHLDCSSYKLAAKLRLRHLLRAAPG